MPQSEGRVASRWQPAIKASTRPALAALPFCQSPGGSSKCAMHKEGADEGTRPAAELLFSPKPSQRFCREEPAPSVRIQRFSLSLQTSGEGEGEGNREEEGGKQGKRGRELSLVLASARGNVFSLKNSTTTRSNEQPSMHMSTRAHAHACQTAGSYSHLP